MPDLSFNVEGAEPVAFAVAPTIVFALSVENQEARESVHNVLLTVQIQIETTKRRYDDEERRRLVELFGEPHRWGDTLKPLLWTHASGVVPAFTGQCTFDLHVPCTFDFNVAATKYFDALKGADIPLLFLFSGTVFHAGSGGALQAARISWSKEARYRLPVETWRKMMNHYYPNTAWLAVNKDTFDMLADYKARNGLSSLDQALESLMNTVTSYPRQELTTK